VQFIYKKRENCFSNVLEYFFYFFVFLWNLQQVYKISKRFGQYFNNPKFSFFFSLKINGQYFGINIGPTSKLIFKYQGLTRKFSEFFNIHQF